MQVYGWKMDEMNMTRTMECKIWIAGQDQIYGRIMELCRKMYGGCARDMESAYGWIKGK